MEEVIGNDPNQPAVADKAQGDTVTIPKSELESLQRTLRETQQSERDWAAMARRGAPAPEPVVEAEEPLDPGDFVDAEAPRELEGDTPEKLVDDLAAEGVKALGRRGFITAADAQKMAVEVASKVTRELIGRERQKLTTDAQIMAEFPDLRDQNSDLFKATAVRYQRAVAMDPNAKKTPAALFLAAEAARESLRAKAAPRRREENDDDEPRGREPEEDRRRRADSQDSRPRTRPPVDDTDDMLGSEARQIIKGFGITDAEFNASRKELGARGRGRR